MVDNVWVNHNARISVSGGIKIVNDSCAVVVKNVPMHCGVQARII